MNSSEQDKLSDMDIHLVCANVAGRRRLGFLGVVALPGAGGELQDRTMFYDFAPDEAEPLMPIGTIESMQDILQTFGPLNDFFNTKDFSEWAEQINTELAVPPLAVSRVYLCSTGKLQLPDSEELVQQTLVTKSQGNAMGFGMDQALVESWFGWALHEEEISKNYSKARRQLAQAIADELNKN